MCHSSNPGEFRLAEEKESPLLFPSLHKEGTKTRANDSGRLQTEVR